MKSGREEIERLIRTHYDLVKMTARRCFPRHFGDEDMLQCGLIGLWEAARRWNGRGDFLPLARRCGLNNMKDYVRAENRAAAIAARYREQRACPPRRSAPAGARDQERLGPGPRGLIWGRKPPRRRRPAGPGRPRLPPSRPARGQAAGGISENEWLEEVRNGEHV
jgi:RNA polymerase sigma factor (sigma-70 family)